MHLNETEIENIEENQPKYFDALSSLNESIVEVKKQFDEVQKQIETTHSNHSDGIPLLRIKVCVNWSDLSVRLPTADIPDRVRNHKLLCNLEITIFLIQSFRTNVWHSI